MIFLPSRSCTVAFSKSRTSYTLPQTSGTPRSMSSRVYTASMPVRMEYSVVKMVSRWVSANWPKNAKFTLPCGTTAGRSPASRGIKNAVMYGIMQGTVLALCSARSSISASGTPMWYSHSMQISLPVHSRIGFLM